MYTFINNCNGAVLYRNQTPNPERTNVFIVWAGGIEHPFAHRSKAVAWRQTRYGSKRH